MSRWRSAFERLLRRARPTPEGAYFLGSRQVYILPTAWGWLFGVLLVALLVAASNYGNNLVFALTFLLAGVGHAGLLLTWRNLAGLQLAIRTPEPVFAGDNAEFPVMVSNDMNRSREGLVIGFKDQPEAPFRVESEEHNGLNVPVTTRTRGVMRPGRITVETRYPLSLFRAWSLLEPHGELMVYPQPLHGYPLPAPAPSDGNEGLSSVRGEEDFAGIRAYQTGDSLHRISWKSSARTGQLQSKEFDRPSDGMTRLDWQDVPAADTEQKLSILTAWVLELAARGESWGLRLPGVELPPASGTLHREQCLAALAEYGLER